MFKKVENHEHYYNVRENKKYGIGIYPVLYGFRVRIWELNSPVCICDLCFGDITSMVNIGYITLLQYLNDGGNPNDIPYQSHKPYPNGCEFTYWLNDYVKKNGIGDVDCNMTEVELNEYRRSEFSKFNLI